MTKVTSEEWFGKAISRMPPIAPDSGPHSCGGIDESLVRQMASSLKPSFLDPRVMSVLQCPRCQWRLYRIREERRRNYWGLNAILVRIVFSVLALMALLVAVSVYTKMH